MKTSKLPEKIDDPLRAQFHRLLGRLVHATASFDFNIGMQLQRFLPPDSRKLEAVLDPKKPFATRLRVLRSITGRMYKGGDEIILNNLSEWFKNADQTRALRNDYAHGRWGFLKGATESDDRIFFTPLNWNFSPDAKPRRESMSLMEFEQQVLAAERLLNDYLELTEKIAKG